MEIRQELLGLRGIYTARDLRYLNVILEVAQKHREEERDIKEDIDVLSMTMIIELGGKITKVNYYNNRPHIELNYDDSIFICIGPVMDDPRNEDDRVH